MLTLKKLNSIQASFYTIYKVDSGESHGLKMLCIDKENGVFFKIRFDSESELKPFQLGRESFNSVVKGNLIEYQFKYSDVNSLTSFTANVASYFFLEYFSLQALVSKIAEFTIHNEPINISITKLIAALPLENTEYKEYLLLNLNEEKPNQVKFF